jgi:hypothetical protein
VSTGSNLAIGLSTGAIQIWDASCAQQIRTCKSHDSRVGVLAWSQSMLASGSRDRAIFLHDVRVATRGDASGGQQTSRSSRDSTSSSSELQADSLAATSSSPASSSSSTRTLLLPMSPPRTVVDAREREQSMVFPLSSGARRRRESGGQLSDIAVSLFSDSVTPNGHGEYCSTDHDQPSPLCSVVVVNSGSIASTRSRSVWAKMVLRRKDAGLRRQRQQAVRVGCSAQHNY